jgi:hypothetical protein
VIKLCEKYGNLGVESGSYVTASATTQFCVCGDFLITVENAANWRIFYLRSCLIRDCRGQVGDFGRAVSGSRNSVSWENRDWLARDRFEVWRLGRGQAEHAVLARPFGRKFAETRDTHSIGQTPLDGCLDEVGCKEGKRESHVDLAHAAALSTSD